MMLKLVLEEFGSVLFQPWFGSSSPVSTKGGLCSPLCLNLNIISVIFRIGKIPHNQISKIEYSQIYEN
jgi:hypothetical protein